MDLTSSASMPGIYSMWIINKSGGLIYNKVSGQAPSALAAFWIAGFNFCFSEVTTCACASVHAGVPVAWQPESERHATVSQHLVRR